METGLHRVNTTQVSKAEPVQDGKRALYHQSAETCPSTHESSTAALRAFDNHNIVMAGEAHGCKQERARMRELVSKPEFADCADDMSVEFGNSLRVSLSLS